MTSAWYREVLQRMPDNSRLLDIGIGTGAQQKLLAALREATKKLTESPDGTILEPTVLSGPLSMDSVPSP